MNKNYRLRTQVGVDREIQVQLDQDWESIEVLSLKILQSETYTRMCSDYGVVAGRVIANGGYGIPNVRVSVFVPITAEDELNPIISTLYPYKVFGDKNEDGYRYNLLPYEPSHGGHSPTGTFPSLDDILTNQTVLEVYEKYYKFTVKTNDSGDYMIFGAPLGNQTVVMDMDLSDIGPFSLGPQDLIRMGRATTDQISGTRFKTSTNLEELPQIVTSSENVEVSPFWGDEGICQVRIQRVDFDLRRLGIEITPTATFMGSLISGVDETPLKQSCRPSLNSGDLCSLTTGPGQIIAIRQTAILDEYDRPYLEQYRLDNDGNVIDENGVWMAEVPMNLDYVITNEFGEQIISPDPSIGVPTAGKYRFKIKWKQPNELSGEVRRAYYLVPNVREYGWKVSTKDPLLGEEGPADYLSAKASYYFGVDWSGYTTSTNPLDQRIVNAINCEDTFYKFEYNKVYTVAQHIDQFSRGIIRSRFIGIKDITNRDCETENNKFPTTDAVMSSDVLYFLVSFLLSILFIPMLSIVYASHILALIFPIIKVLIAFVFGTIGLIISQICRFINWLGGDLDCIGPTDTFNSIMDISNPFTNIPLPMLSYPDCDACSCDVNSLGEGELGKEAMKTYKQNSPSCSASFFNYQNYTIDDDDSKKALAGVGSPNQGERVIRLRTPIYSNVNTAANTVNAVDALPIWERANLFNLKSKYFDTDVTNGSNRIKVVVEPTLNDSDPNKYHYDNVLIYLVDNDCLSKFPKGKLLSFNGGKTNDPNPIEPQTGTTVVGISGTTTSTGNLTVTWADETGINKNNKTTNYAVPSFSDEVKYKFPTDVEYFQVITGMTVSQFTANTDNTSPILYNYTKRVLTNTQGNFRYQDNYENYDNLGIVILVRGVDPNSGRHKIRYNISRLLGWSSYIGNYDIEGDFYLNVPIQKGETTVRHNQITSSNSVTPQGKIYYPSYYFTPGTQFSSYTTNTHSYYSSLDCTQVNNFYIDPVDKNNTFLFDRFVSSCSPTTNSLKTNISGGGNSLVRSGSSNTGGYYFNAEYIEGGSYITTEPVFDTSGVINNYKYFAPAYGTGLTMTVSNTNIVMRSDRLPTGTILDSSGNNVFAWQSSNTLSLTLYTDGGSATSVQQNFGFGTTIKLGDAEDFGSGATYNKVLESFSCDRMVDLDCYEGSGLNFTAKSPNDDCNKNGFNNYKIVNGGCYSFVNLPIVTIFDDFGNLVEWLNRYRITYALCRGVVGHTFTNAWINGVLYSYPFALETTFDNDNKPVSKYCKQTLFLDTDTSNFYYRSSPYVENSGSFIGKQLDYPVKFNDKLIQTPTTILDMGPKYFWSREVSFSPNYFGYIMDQIPATSYQDVSDLSQLFAVSRLTNSSFLGSLLNVFSDLGVVRLFSRNNLRVDGDYAQSIQINSQFGVYGFNTENYQQTASSNTSPIFVGQDNKGNALMGVFFSSTTQNRDYISPRRIDRNEMTLILKADYLPTSTQKVPYYKWTIDNSSGFIFGTEQNTWETANDIVDANGYQDFERENSPFYIGESAIVKFNPGFIYSAKATTTPGVYDYQPLISPNSANKTMVSAPWYFYFGLKKGKSAMDKFYSTYIDTI
jgi:hypothetical protein